MAKDILIAIALLYIFYSLKSQRDALNKLAAQWQNDAPSLDTIYKS